MYDFLIVGAGLFGSVFAIAISSAVLLDLKHGQDDNIIPIIILFLIDLCYYDNEFLSLLFLNTIITITITISYYNFGIKKLIFLFFSYTI